MANTSLVVSLIGKDQSLGKTLAGAGKEADKTKSKFDKLGKGIAGLAAGITIGAVLKSSITAASDLNETMNKSRAIFGQSAMAMEDWAKDAAKNMGLSKAAALESAASFGDMFSQLGWGADEAAKMSREVVQLSADLGSFNDLPTADVAERIAAGFRGEYDSLQKLIPNINAARVQTEALAATGKDNAAQLTAQEKAAATLAIVQKDGARAAGDFARTGDEFANSTKTLTAEVENAKAALGEALLPVMKEALGVANLVLGAFNSLPGPVKTLTVAIGASAVAYRYLAPAAAGSGKALKSMRSLFVANTAATVADTAATNANTVAKQRNAAVVPGAFMRQSMASGVAGGGLTASALVPPAALATAGSVFSGWVGKMTTEAGGAGAGIAAAFSGGLSGLPALIGVAMADTSKEIARLDELDRDLAEGFTNSTWTAEQMRDALVEVADATGQSVDELIGKMPMLSAALVSPKNPATGLGDAIGGLSDEAKAAKEEVSKFKQALSDLFTPQMDLQQATIAYKDGLQSLTESVRENGASLSVNTAAGRSNLSAVLAQINRNRELAEATFQATGSTEKASAAYNRATKELLDSASAAGLSRDEVNKLISRMNATPKKVRTVFETPGLREGVVAASQLQDITRSLDGKTITYTIQGVTKNIPAVPGITRPELLTAQATGGPADGWTIVGERGPELTYMAPGSVVYDHNRSMRVLKGTAAKGKRNRRANALQSLNDLVAQRNQQSLSVAESLRGYGSITGFDTTNVADARSDLNSAIEDEHAARRAVNLARGHKEQAEALDRLREAEERIAQARKRVAEVEVTPQNVLNRMRQKLAKISRFKTVLQQLGKAGLNHATLKDIIAEGPEAGLAIGEALLRGGIADANLLQYTMAQETAAIGLQEANLDFGSKIREATKQYNRTAGRGDRVVVQLLLDGKIVAESTHEHLLAKKRKNGRRKLGLD